MKTSVIQVRDVLSLTPPVGTAAAPAPTAAKPKSAPGVAPAGDEKKDKAPSKS